MLTRLPAMTREFFHAALALLVVAALAHCSWEEGREVAARAQVIAGQRNRLPAPLQLPVHDCGHESSCICRGATMAGAVDVAHFAATATQLLPIDLDLPPVWHALDDAADHLVWPDDADSHGPPISGRQLRALYASLLI